MSFHSLLSRVALHYIQTDIGLQRLKADLESRDTSDSMQLGLQDYDLDFTNVSSSAVREQQLHILICFVEKIASSMCRKQFFLYRGNQDPPHFATEGNGSAFKKYISVTIS